MGESNQFMPLTDLQLEIARLLSSNRTPDSHLAGAAALHFAPNSKRYSNDLDYFHDSVERVAEAFDQDRRLLEASGYVVNIEINQPGYISADVIKKVVKDKIGTKVEWAHDSAWRFMPSLHNPIVGYQLHPIDLAINKVLALAGRDEPRDFLDILNIHQEIVSLGALCWAAVGKDPGFTPFSLLELLKRRGKYRPEDFNKLMLTSPVDLVAMKTTWLEAVVEAERFITTRPPEEIGCLYWSKSKKKFITPSTNLEKSKNDLVLHFGRPGGIMPKINK